MEKKSNGRKVARVFFSSPFGGLEEEREELTKKYWPKLAHQCSRAGYEFVPVDMRWGITSEHSAQAATIAICLRELDRSDIIVGFFGQRYGWHGKKDEMLQKTFDFALPNYPWLNSYRDRSVTELEFLHGHLNKPGARPACFFFRDKAYDESQRLKFEKKGDERNARKFTAFCDGPKADVMLDALKERVAETKDNVLALYPNYQTPAEGARLMYETVHNYLKDHLLAHNKTLTSREEELSRHDAYYLGHLGMGGKCHGADQYYEQIYSCVSPKSTQRHMLVTGLPGSGKTCLLSNFLTSFQQKFPKSEMVYHFVTATSKSTDERNLLQRICMELEYLLEEDSTLKSDMGVQELKRNMQLLMSKVVAKKKHLVVIIDALNKIEKGGKTAKILYWLPSDPPVGVHYIVSTVTADVDSISELVENRKFNSITISPLSSLLRKDVTRAMLKVRGKELSSVQEPKVIEKEQTSNPLYLMILLQELCSFGSFFELDDYINSLLEANDTTSLFQKVLQRLERDYNSSRNVVKEIMSCIWASHDGISENEIKTIADVNDQEWLQVFFAIEFFLIESSGLYRGDESSYDLISYWNSIDVIGEEMMKLYMEVVNEQSVLLYLDNLDIGSDSPPAKLLLEFVNAVADFLESAGHITCLEVPLLRALQLHDNLYDEETMHKNDDVLSDYCMFTNKLACAYASNEKFELAKKYHLRILELKEKYIKELGMSSLAETFNNLAFIDYRQGRLNEAFELFSKALQLQKESGGSKVLVAESYNNLGQIQAQLGQYEEGSKLLEKALEIYEEYYFGSLPPNVGGTLLNLAMAYVRLPDKNVDEICKIFQRSVDIRRNAFGDEHPSVAQSLMSYGVQMMRLDMYNKALEMSLQALQVFKRCHGLEHADTLRAMENIAICYMNNKDMENAHVFFHKAGEILEKQGRLNMSSSGLNNQMINHYFSIKDFKNASRTIQRVLQTDSVMDQHYALYNTAVEQLASEGETIIVGDYSVDAGLRKFPNSKQLLGIKIREYSKTGDADKLLQHLEAGQEFDASDYNYCYSQFVQENQRSNGVKLLESAIARFPEDVVVLENLAKCYAVTEDYVSAIAILDKGRSAAPDNLDLLMIHGRVNAMAGNIDSAKMLFASGLDIAKKTDATDMCDTFSTMLKHLDG
ncbi:uncharacterized protein [Antedon mediterranea]|uniref:uncharacterized protein n=1 Tax=Antedon mediterranea TaxID=105859 RepID=UPI003AF67E59